MKTTPLLIFLLFATLSFGQVEDALIFFADKENVEASIANPITILTQAAIDRKMLHHTPIDERDVPLNETYKSTVASQPGITVYAKSKWLNAVYVRGNKNSIDNLINLSFVTHIEFMNKNYNLPFQPRPVRDKFEIEIAERANYNYGSALNQTEMINIDAVHRDGFSGEGMTIAFLDNGYPNVTTNRAYANMRDEGRLLGYYDFVDRVENPNGTGSHGSSTLSTAATFLEGEFVGTGPKASYYLFITEDGRQESPLEEAYWVEALERADSLGVFVTNTSLGYQDFDNPNYDYRYSDMDGQTTIGARGANHGFDKGMINVVSAGNAALTFGYITSPADAPGAFTVGAVDANEDYAWFSSFGPTYDGRVKPDVMAQGLGTAIVDPYGNVTSSNGTSFSAPIIAGSMASLWQVAPHLKNHEIMQAVRESADRFHNPTHEMGYGIPDFSEALAMVKQLSVEDRLQQNLFAVYPNPITDQIFISFPKNATAAELVLYNVLGKELLRRNLSPTQNRIEVSDLPSGIYIASITSNHKTSSFKLIKK